MARLGILADDLTGLAAMVSEAAFGGLSAQMSRLNGQAPDTDIWGIDLNCRESSPGVNFERAARALDRLADWECDDIIVKIDSLWRGHPEKILNAALGRHSVAVFNDHFNPCSAPVRHHGGSNVIDHLEIVLDARLAGVRCWLGGLTLARAVRWSSLSQRHPILAIVGSRESASDEQVRYCAAQGVSVFRFDATLTAEILSETLGRKMNVIITEQEGRDASEIDARAAEAQFAHWANLISQLERSNFGGMILSGGHTASTVLARLGTTEFAITGAEPEVGLPIAMARNGLMRGKCILTKPGHFGTARTLQNAFVAMQLLCNIE